MKKAVVLAFVCLFGLCALAAEKSITINSATTMNGTAVAPGPYKVKYEIKGSQADVKLIRDGKTVATASGEVVEQKYPAPYDSIVNQANSDGTSSIIELQFAKQKQVIRLTAETGTAVGK